MYMKRILATTCLVMALSSNAQTVGQVEAEIRRQGLPHPHIVLAQARLETGNFTSRRCKGDKNLFGMKRGNRYATYRRWQDSIADYKIRISKRYKGGDYYTFLRRIGYAEDKEYCKKIRRIANSDR